MNSGHLRTLVRDRYLVDAKGLNKIRGQPFHVDEIAEAIRTMLADQGGNGHPPPTHGRVGHPTRPSSC